MATILSEELQAAVQQHGERPVEAIDPTTNKCYVVVAREQYDRLKPLFESDPISEQEQLELLRKAGARAGWDDAEMDAYDRYDEHRVESP